MSPTPRSSLRTGMQASGSSYWLPLMVLVFVGFDVPILFLIGWSVSNPMPTLLHYVELFGSATYLNVFRNTFGLALLVTVICVLAGYPLAYWMHDRSPRTQTVLLAFVVLPFWVSILVRTYAWIVVLGNAGVVNRSLAGLGLIEAPVRFLYNPVGVTVGTVNILLPFLVLPLLASMKNIDLRLLHAAVSLGASHRTIFWRVFFPLSAPALAAGAILVFILSLGFFVTPAILGGGKVMMVSNMLDLLINELPRWELAAAASVVLLAVTLALYAASRRIDKIHSV